MHAPITDIEVQGSGSNTKVMLMYKIKDRHSLRIIRLIPVAVPIMVHGEQLEIMEMRVSLNLPNLSF